MTELIKRFLDKIQAIKALRPTYRQPGDGSDGTCDCIGLIIGAIRRMGLKWTGIHGSNYAARKAMTFLQPISSIDRLQPGDIVYKAYNPGEGKYNLPARYKQGGAYYNGDLKDYYHVGVVTQVNPLNITHMTSPTVKVDTKLGKWAYFGQLKLLSSSAQPSTGIGSAVSDSKPAQTVKPVQEATTGAVATVTAPSGKYVKMRKQPSQSCGVYDEVPVGAKVTLVKPGEVWAQIDYGRRKGWYMMAKFLDVGGQTK